MLFCYFYIRQSNSAIRASEHKHTHTHTHTHTNTQQVPHWMCWFWLQAYFYCVVYCHCLFRCKGIKVDLQAFCSICVITLVCSVSQLTANSSAFQKGSMIVWTDHYIYTQKSWVWVLDQLVKAFHSCFHWFKGDDYLLDWFSMCFWMTNEIV
jgi:hypothetical protein